MHVLLHLLNLLRKTGELLAKALHNLDKSFEKSIKHANSCIRQEENMVHQRLIKRFFFKSGYNLHSMAMGEFPK